MKIGAIKQITSELETHNFYIETETDDEISYSNYDENISICFDITKRCPATLLPEFIRCAQEGEIKSKPAALRLTGYRIKLNDLWIHINTEMFILETKIPSAYFFSNKEELLVVAQKLTRSTIDDVLPCMRDILRNAIFCTKQMHEKLSVDPKGTAQSFAKTYHLPETSLEESVALARAFLNPMIPADITKRRKIFYENEELLVGLAAYLGETVIRELSGYWEWLYTVPLPHQYDEVKKDVFVVVSSEFEHRYFCPLYNIENHWNFFKKVSALGLDHFIPPW